MRARHAPPTADAASKIVKLMPFTATIALCNVLMVTPTAVAISALLDTFFGV